MGGFIRRFTTPPGTSTIKAIEGVVIVDLPPPGNVEGVGTGTVCLVGEFQDVTHAVLFNPATGVFSTSPHATEVFSAQDLVSKFGGFDATIGEFGKSGGNGFVALRNKQFARLLCIPVNIASAAGMRVFRRLATNVSATNPAPVVAVVGVTLPAGTQFVDGSAHRVKSAGPVSFTGGESYDSGTDGSTTSGASATTQTFSSAGGAFTTVSNPNAPHGTGVQPGDILVLGVIGGAGALGSNADTYRVVSVTSATALVVEKMDGSSFAFATSSTQPWRIHTATTADTGTSDITNAGGVDYSVPARPLDATIAAASLLQPSVVPPALTATTADPLSGLEAAAFPGSGGIVYDGTVQAPNVGVGANLDALYLTSIAAVNINEEPANDANILWAARTSTNIRASLNTQANNHSANGTGCSAVVAPGLDTQSLAAAIAATDPGVGANRSERVDYCWPGVRTFVPEAAGISLSGADGTQVTDGTLDDRWDGWMAVLLSNLNPELNPGQSASPVPALLSPILAFQRGAPSLGLSEYIRLRASGVAAPKMDLSTGFILQSGVTSSLVSGQTSIKRRRMADFIEDSLAQALNQFTKQLLTNALKDQITAETNAFLSDLLSPENPSAQRIAAYQVDPKSGNTPTLLGQGIFVLIVNVQLLPSADFIVLQASIGETVVIQQLASQ